MSLQNEIKSYFDRAATLVYDGPSVIHPIITLNVLKNIIGDNRKNPSKKFESIHSSDYPVRVNLKEELPGNNTKDGNSFVADWQKKNKSF